MLFKTTRPFTCEEKHLIASKLKRIPGVLHATLGANYTARGLGYTSGAVIRLANKEAESCYQSHPIHIEVGDFLKPLIAKGVDHPVLAVDYEWLGPTSYRPDWDPRILIGAAAGFLLGLAMSHLRA